MTKKKNEIIKAEIDADYAEMLKSVAEVLEQSRRMTARSVNAIMTETYSKISLEFPLINEEIIYNSATLNFLGLKNELEGKSLKECFLILLEDFFLKKSFAVVSRNKTFKSGNISYCVDLVLFNRRLRCLVVIDLKLGKITHADIGQMLLYTNYADEHWREEGENPPVGLILCDEKNDALAHYTLENLPNKILASEYKTVLPSEELLIEKIKEARRLLEARNIVKN